MNCALYVDVIASVTNAYKSECCVRLFCDTIIVFSSDMIIDAINVNDGVGGSDFLR